MELEDVENTFDISPDMTESLSLLKMRLDFLQTHLATDLFGEFWRLLAQIFDAFVYEEVSSKFHFTPSGAYQFEHDMKALFLIWKSFTDRPENHFKK